MLNEFKWFPRFWHIQNHKCIYYHDEICLIKSDHESEPRPLFFFWAQTYSFVAACAHPQMNERLNEPSVQKQSSFLLQNLGDLSKAHRQPGGYLPSSRLLLHLQLVCIRCKRLSVMELMIKSLLVFETRAERCLMGEPLRCHIVFMVTWWWSDKFEKEGILSPAVTSVIQAAQEVV